VRGKPGPRESRRSGIHDMLHFAGAFQHDVEVIKNAMLKPWSKGRTEGRNNRLKTRKWTKCGRAGIDLLCARLMVLDA